MRIAIPLILLLPVLLVGLAVAKETETEAPALSIVSRLGADSISIQTMP